MKIIVLQPTVPSYRRGFFRRLHEHFGHSFLVCASRLDLGVLTPNQPPEVWEHHMGTVVTLLPGLHWQRGVLSIPFAKGDVIVVTGNPRYLSTIALLLKARWKGAKTIWWGHLLSSTGSASRTRLRLRLMRLVDAVLFYTDCEVAEYAASNGRHARYVAALNNGLDIERIERLRLGYSAAERPKNVLFIGRLTEKSALPLLLQSLARPECADVELDVIGQADGAVDFRALATSLGIGGRVTWHGGTVDEAKIARVANRCRIFVYPGGVGLSLIHGLDYGLPAVVHSDRRSHMPEIAAFRDNVNGLTFRKNDVESAAGVVRRLVNDVRLLNEFSREAIATVTNSFNARDMSSRFIALIESVSAPAVQMMTHEEQRNGGSLAPQPFRDGVPAGRLDEPGR